VGLVPLGRLEERLFSFWKILGGNGPEIAVVNANLPFYVLSSSPKVC
jgi:hypothetical protein